MPSFASAARAVGTAVTLGAAALSLSGKAQAQSLPTDTEVHEICATRIAGGIKQTDCITARRTIEQLPQAEREPERKPEIPLAIYRISDYPPEAQRPPAAPPCGCKGQGLRPGQGNGG